MHPLFHPLFIDFCAYFNGNEDYFECHEVLEEYWKDIAPGERFHPLVGYVQLATGMYHWRRDNRSGATRTLQKALHNFEQNVDSAFFAYIDYRALVAATAHAAHAALAQPFQPFRIVLTHEELAAHVAHTIAQLPATDAHFLLHKHTLRDRSAIIAARDAKRKKS